MAPRSQNFWSFFTGYYILTSKTFWLILGGAILIGIIGRFFWWLVALAVAAPFLSVLGDYINGVKSGSHDIDPPHS